MAKLCEHSLNNIERIPDQLTQTKAVLLPRNDQTQGAKNYISISPYPVYASCLNSFLFNHCEANNVFTPEQAGEKKKIWGTIEQTTSE